MSQLPNCLVFNKERKSTWYLYAGLFARLNGWEKRFFVNVLNIFVGLWWALTETKFYNLGQFRLIWQKLKAEFELKNQIQDNPLCGCHFSQPPISNHVIFSHFPLSFLNIHWKDWCWSWSSNTLATDVKNWLIGNASDDGKDWRQEKKGKTEDEMVVCHHQFDGHDFEQAQGFGDGQGSLACSSPWGTRESNKTEWLKYEQSDDVDNDGG